MERFMATKVNIGIADQDREKVARSLASLLADSYTLYLLTHNFHWNVTGPQFRTLHLMFEEQYTELATAVDEIAERIRTLGYPAPGTYREFAKLTSIQEIGRASCREGLEVLVVGEGLVQQEGRVERLRHS